MQPQFTVQDRVQTSQANYLYTFGICSDVEPPTNCLDAAGKSRVKYTTAPAWQTRSDESKSTADPSSLTCKYLGAPDEASRSWQVIDAEDPAKGVTLTYSDGQSCSSGLRRKFGINFKCAARTVEKIEEKVIDESAHCEYEINIDSEFACPTECGLAATGSICASHGLCGYDTSTKKAKCFCNSGRTGTHCTETVESASSQFGAVIGLLIFIMLILLAIVGLLVFMWRFLQSRKLGDVYTSLKEPTFTDDSLDRFELERVDIDEQGTDVVPMKLGSQGGWAGAQL